MSSLRSSSPGNYPKYHCICPKYHCIWQKKNCICPKYHCICPKFNSRSLALIALALFCKYLTDPGEARGCSITASWLIPSFIHSFSEWVSQPFPPTVVRRRHAQTVRVSTSSYKIDYVIMIKNFLNPEGHQNPFSGSKVTAILLKGWIWPIGGASRGGSALQPSQKAF